jgi:hypothetical protein
MKFRNNMKKIKYKRAINTLDMLISHLNHKINFFKLGIAKGKSYSDRYKATIEEDLEILEILETIRELLHS